MSSVAIIGTRGYPSYYGGFETAVRRIAPYLADRGWEVTVYGRPGLKPPAPGDPVRSIVPWGINTKATSTLSYGLSSSIHTMARRPDIALVMNCANGLWLPLLKARGIPSVVNVDGIEWEREKWGGLARRTFLVGARGAVRHADELVVDARAIGERWQEQFGRSGEFIPYGADVPPVTEAPLGLKRGGYVLLVARFVPENSVGAFFEAAERIAARWPVVLVGSSGYGGEWDDRAQFLADSVSGVRWLGQVSDDDLLFSLWRNAGVYFHGHSVGGTNPALVQAMAAGAPVVARDTVFNREVLGEGAVFVEPDAGEIADAILSLMVDDPRRGALVELARARYEAEYTWERVLERYAELLTRVIEERAGTRS